MKNLFRFVALALVLCPASVITQTPPAGSPQPTTAQPQAPRTSTPPRTQSTSGQALTIEVTDKSGNGIGSVQVSSNGPVDRTGTTGQDGSLAFRSMRAGSYRLRFEREGYVTLERDIVLRDRSDSVSVALTAAPAKPAAPVTLPSPPAPVPQPPAANRAVEPRSLSIPDFLDTNLIGSEPQKQTQLGCAVGGTARLLQVRDPLTDQRQADGDQMLYVVAGSGVIRVRNQDIKAGPGFFAMIPRGIPYGIRREGRNPIILVSVLAGPTCNETAPAATP
jgi:mannose-6-phosphate isomerase-like protein (cupin superfamily)